LLLRKVDTEPLICFLYSRMKKK